MEKVLYTDSFCMIAEIDDKAYYCDALLGFKKLGLQKARLISSKIKQALKDGNKRMYEFYYNRI